MFICTSNSKVSQIKITCWSVLTESTTACVSPANDNHHTVPDETQVVHVFFAKKVVNHTSYFTFIVQYVNNCSEMGQWAKMKLNNASQGLRFKQNNVSFFETKKVCIRSEFDDVETVTGVSQFVAVVRLQEELHKACLR